MQQDLQAGVNPRAAKPAEKSRQRAAEHRSRTSKERVTDWKAFERTRPEDAYEATAKWDSPEEPRKRNLVPKKHRGGRERSEKKRKKHQQERLAIQEEENLIAMQMAELKKSGIRLQLCSGTRILRNTDPSQVQVEAKGQVNLQVKLKEQTTKRSNLILPLTGWKSNSVRILKYHPR